MGSLARAILDCAPLGGKIKVSVAGRCEADRQLRKPPAGSTRLAGEIPRSIRRRPRHFCVRPRFGPADHALYLFVLARDLTRRLYNFAGNIGPKPDVVNLSLRKPNSFPPNVA
jgi:hypothetical protein